MGDQHAWLPKNGLSCVNPSEVSLYCLHDLTNIGCTCRQIRVGKRGEQRFELRGRGIERCVDV